MDDVLVVGAGPAGVVAATVLARAGARVRVLDRVAFPRAKLCGDTLNPGTLAILRRLDLSFEIERDGLPIDGMRVTGEGGVSVEGRYPGGLRGRAISRSALDWSLLRQAIAAGARFEHGVTVRAPLVGVRRGHPAIDGVVATSPGGTVRLRASVTIAADGRRSAIAFGLGLARHPARPRRWAIGGYFEGVEGRSSCGEMHIRRGRYIGIAPLPEGRTNVCLVKLPGRGESDLRDPAAALAREIAADGALRDRFVDARLVAPPSVLGPLAVDADGTAPDGLLLAGDAAGFVDPMTGDGLRFAVRGGELAALSALRALEHGWSGAGQALARWRAAEFGSKYRFNRALRALVASPVAVQAGTACACVVPTLVRAIILHAGDCGLAR
jgi:flavin-dependent dehydrogenase